MDAVLQLVVERGEAECEPARVVGHTHLFRVGDVVAELVGEAWRLQFVVVVEVGELQFEE